MIKTDLSQIIYSLAKALDLSVNGIANHHQTVALIALAIANKLNMPESERNLTFLSALVHDAGIISGEETKRVLLFEDVNPYQHCQKGYEIFSGSIYTQEIAKILLSHHDRWEGLKVSGLANNEIPLASNIIYLADRVAVLINSGNGYILNRSGEIIEKIKNKKGAFFNPLVVDAFMEASRVESFWLDLQPEIISDLINQVKPRIKIMITPDELVDLAYAFSKIIDDKSPYTYNHSNAVALVAEFLADKFGFTPAEQTLIKIAGYLHDLGKIAVPNKILDKPAKLTPEEFAVIKNHPYYSYRLLQNIPGFEQIAAWGPHHHERLDGSGYPLGLKGEQISLGAKIMAVSDMFVALTEDRPYREGMSRNECLSILTRAAELGQIDGRVVTTVEMFYTELSERVFDRKQLGKTV